MRYRMLTASGDYSFGQGTANFFVDDPQAVGQSVLTRLRLWQEEWFLDKTEGTPYSTQVLGYNTKNLRDAAIRQRVLQTVGVVSIESYGSTFDPETRAFTVTDLSILTQYSHIPVQLSPVVL